MSPFSVSKQIAGLFGWVVLSFSAAAIGSVASVRAASFYGELVRPDWSPPQDVFGPVWTVLYLLMGIAAWLVWRRGGFGAARTALTLFIVQLAVNALWSWCFFAWQLGALALADIVLLWLLIGATIAAFWRISRLAGAMLLPYWAWVSFATALNFALWHLNPGVLG